MGDVLGCLEKGNKWHLEFLDGCFRDRNWFEKPIPRRKTKMVASSASQLWILKSLTLAGLDKFVCALYGRHQMASVNSLRYATFQQHYMLKKQDEPQDGIK